MIDWYSKESHLLMNPRMIEAEKRAWTNGIDLNAFESHIFLSTSGSTSLKFVALSKQAFLSSAKAVNEHLRVTNKDVWLNPLPHFHVGGLSIFARSFLSRSKVESYLDKWSSVNFYNALKSSKASLTALVPTQLYDLVIAGLESPKCLRAVVIGGGFLEPKLYKKARDLKWPVLPSYGMTEMCSQVATATLSSLESLDYPSLSILSCFEIKNDIDNCFLIKSPSCFTAYAILDNNKISYQHHKDIFFKTKDVGSIRDNCISIDGRLSDFIKIGGESVNMLRLQSIFDQAKVECSINFDAVITDIDDERLGSAIHLFTTSDNYHELKHNYDANVLPFERIRKVHLLNQIPRSPLNKLLKHHLIT